MLFPPAEEVVVGGVRHECLLADIVEVNTTIGRSESALGVQTLNVGGFCQCFPAGWSLLIADRLQQEAGNRVVVGATRVRAGIDGVYFCAQTSLLSDELCQVAMPTGNGLGAAVFGLSSGLRKWVMI